VSVASAGPNATLGARRRIRLLAPNPPARRGVRLPLWCSIEWNARVAGYGFRVDDGAPGVDDPGAGRQVGVGPWRGPWPAGAHWDPELLANGDRRNVVDRYRYWRLDAVVADLDARRHSFHVAIENWGHDFNIGSVVRTANAMGAAAFHIVGHRRWNRRGAMVTDRYQHERHHGSVAEFVAWAGSAGPDGARLPLIGVDNIPGSEPLETSDLPRDCVLVFGQEGPGLTPAMANSCAVVLHVEQFGSTRSMNAGAAAAIAMHAWVRRHVFGQPVAGDEGSSPTGRSSK
jgi:tRNA(Leu) C34 or U34 (ribose-2'-O)-methylase TrmL